MSAFLACAHECPVSFECGRPDFVIRQSAMAQGGDDHLTRARRVQPPGINIDEHGVAERVCALVEGGQLEAQGNLSRWRHSEVKLPD
jgi:hypothetical protein